MNGVRLGDIPGGWRGAAGCGWLEYEAFNIRKTSHQKEAILWRQIRGPRSVADLGSRAPYQPIVCSSQAAEATGLLGLGRLRKLLACTVAVNVMIATCGNIYQSPIAVAFHYLFHQVELVSPVIVNLWRQCHLIPEFNGPLDTLCLPLRHGGDDTEVIFCRPNPLPLYLSDSWLLAHHNSYFTPRDDTQSQQDPIPSPRRCHR
jgi:hypothetical protein